MTTVLNGLLGGVIAGVVATATTGFLGDGSTATAVSRAVFGDTAATSRWWNYLLCVGYGCIAGGVLVALDLFVFGVLGVPPTTGEALSVAAVWSIVLFVAVVGGRRFVLARPVDRASLVGLVGYHLVYGLGLGVWIRATWIT